MVRMIQLSLVTSRARGDKDVKEAGHGVVTCYCLSGRAETVSLIKNVKKSMVVIILNEQQEQQPKRGKYNSLFYFLEIRSSKFLLPAVQDLYVFVHQINFIFLATENAPLSFHYFAMLHQTRFQGFYLGNEVGAPLTNGN